MFPCLVWNFPFLYVVHLTSSVSAPYQRVCSQYGDLPTSVVSCVRDSGWCHDIMPMSCLFCDASTVEYKPYCWVILLNFSGVLWGPDGSMSWTFMWVFFGLKCAAYPVYLFHGTCFSLPMPPDCLNFLNDSHSWMARIVKFDPAAPWRVPLLLQFSLLLASLTSYTLCSSLTYQPSLCHWEYLQGERGSGEDCMKNRDLLNVREAVTFSPLHLFPSPPIFWGRCLKVRRNTLPDNK